jgi:hypothetical protein
VRLLANAGIDAAAPRQLGALEAFRRVRATTPRASLDPSWALEGALTDRAGRPSRGTDRARLAVHARRRGSAPGRASRLRCSLFAVRCSLFAVRCSLFAVRYSLFAFC